ncbi:hypothetical protein WJX74_010750 [Apatococcus lobatus]|uniref:Uncharacterized protein n=1 Tax=Apatococcus lobatus TaxID=904363 RepID=A0AAW1RLX1_9CHLO
MNGLLAQVEEEHQQRKAVAQKGSRRSNETGSLHAAHRLDSSRPLTSYHWTQPGRAWRRTSSSPTKRAAYEQSPKWNSRKTADIGLAEDHPDALNEPAHQTHFVIGRVGNRSPQAAKAAARQRFAHGRDYLSLESPSSGPSLNQSMSDQVLMGSPILGVSRASTPRSTPGRDVVIPRREALAVLHSSTLTRNPILSATPSPKPTRPLHAAKQQSSGASPSAAAQSFQPYASPSHAHLQLQADNAGDLLSECGSPAMEMLDAADTLMVDMDSMDVSHMSIKAIRTSVSAPSPALLVPEEDTSCQPSSAAVAAAIDVQPACVSDNLDAAPVDVLPAPVQAQASPSSSSELLLRQMRGLLGPFMTPMQPESISQRRQQQQQHEQQQQCTETDQAGETKAAGISKPVSPADPGHMLARSLPISPRPAQGRPGLRSWLHVDQQQENRPEPASSDLKSTALETVRDQAASAADPNSNSYIHESADNVSTAASAHDAGTFGDAKLGASGTGSICMEVPAQQHVSILLTEATDEVLTSSPMPGALEGEYQARSPIPLWQARLSEGLGPAASPGRPMRLLHLDSRGRFDDANAVHYSLDFEEDRDDFSPSLGPTSMRWASRFSEGMSALGSDEEFQAEVRRRLFPASPFNHPALPMASHTAIASLGSSSSDLSQHGLSISITSTQEPGCTTAHQDAPEGQVSELCHDNASAPRDEDDRLLGGKQHENHNQGADCANRDAAAFPAQKQRIALLPDMALEEDSSNNAPRQQQWPPSRQQACAEASLCSSAEGQPARHAISSSSPDEADSRNVIFKPGEDKPVQDVGHADTSASMTDALHEQLEAPVHGILEDGQQPAEPLPTALPACAADDQSKSPLNIECKGRDNHGDDDDGLHKAVESSANQHAHWGGLRKNRQDHTPLEDNLAARSSQAYSESFEAVSEADAPCSGPPAPEGRAFAACTDTAPPAGPLHPDPASPGGLEQEADTHMEPVSSQGVALNVQEEPPGPELAEGCQGLAQQPPACVPTIMTGVSSTAAHEPHEHPQMDGVPASSCCDPEDAGQKDQVEANEQTLAPPSSSDDVAAADLDDHEASGSSSHAAHCRDCMADDLSEGMCLEADEDALPHAHSQPGISPTTCAFLHDSSYEQAPLAAGDAKPGHKDSSAIHARQPETINSSTANVSMTQDVADCAAFANGDLDLALDASSNPAAKDLDDHAEATDAESTCHHSQEASELLMAPEACHSTSDAWEDDSVLRQSSTLGGQEQDDEEGEGLSPRIRALGRLKSRAQERRLASISSSLNRPSTRAAEADQEHFPMVQSADQMALGRATLLMLGAHLQDAASSLQKYMPSPADNLHLRRALEQSRRCCSQDPQHSLHHPSSRRSHGSGLAMSPPKKASPGSVRRQCSMPADGSLQNSSPGASVTTQGSKKERRSLEGAVMRSLQGSGTHTPHTDGDTDQLPIRSNQSSLDGAGMLPMQPIEMSASRSDLDNAHQSVRSMQDSLDGTVPSKAAHQVAGDAQTSLPSKPASLLRGSVDGTAKQRGYANRHLRQQQAQGKHAASTSLPPPLPVSQAAAPATPAGNDMPQSGVIPSCMQADQSSASLSLCPSAAIPESAGETSQGNVHNSLSQHDSASESLPEQPIKALPGSVPANAQKSDLSRIRPDKGPSSVGLDRWCAAAESAGIPQGFQQASALMAMSLSYRLDMAGSDTVPLVHSCWVLNAAFQGVRVRRKMRSQGVRQLVAEIKDTAALLQNISEEIIHAGEPHSRSHKAPADTLFIYQTRHHLCVRRQQLVDIINKPGLPPKALAITKPVVNAPQRARSFAQRPSTTPAPSSFKSVRGGMPDATAQDAIQRAAENHEEGSVDQDEHKLSLSSVGDAWPGPPDSAAEGACGPLSPEDMKPGSQDEPPGNDLEDHADACVDNVDPATCAIKPKRKASTLRLCHRRKANCAHRGARQLPSEELLPAELIAQNLDCLTESSAGACMADDAALPGHELGDASPSQLHADDDSLHTADDRMGSHNAISSASQTRGDVLDPCPFSSDGQSTEQGSAVSSQCDASPDDQAWQSEAYALEDSQPGHPAAADQMSLRVSCSSGAQLDGLTQDQQQHQQRQSWDASEQFSNKAHVTNNESQQRFVNPDSPKFLRKTSRRQNVWRLPDYSLVKPRTNCHLEPHFKPLALAGDARTGAPGLGRRQSLARPPSRNALSHRSSLQRPVSWNRKLEQPAWESSGASQQKRPVVAWNSRAASAPQTQRAARSSSFQSHRVSQEYKLRKKLSVSEDMLPIRQGPDDTIQAGPLDDILGQVNDLLHQVNDVLGY